jgi:hypothetical protein
MAATAKPTATYAASVMCSASVGAAALFMAFQGSTSTAWPSTMRKPLGVFIQPLARTTKIPETAPLSATSTPAAQCARGGTWSQP